MKGLKKNLVKLCEVKIYKTSFREKEQQIGLPKVTEEV